ncbi:MAG: ATP synthase F1 subunit delta [Actinomycetota bacterium]|jgi:F-type H+-transporting ATPase subunit delta
MQAGAPDERVDGYAAALVEVARAEGQLARVADELFGFAREFERNDALRLALTDQQLPPDRRQAIAEEVLGQKASHLSASLVSFVIGAGRARHMVAIADRLVERAAQERQREVAEVRSAIPLDAEVQARLERALSKALDRNVDVKVVVDPAVLGGVVARVGDTVIDGSVRHRLEKLREVL